MLGVALLGTESVTEKVHWLALDKEPLENVSIELPLIVEPAPQTSPEGVDTAVRPLKTVFKSTVKARLETSAAALSL